MKYLLLILLLLLPLAGCATNTTTTYISAQGSVTYNATNSVAKPVTVDTSAQGNVPLQGGSVTNPTNH